MSSIRKMRELDAIIERELGLELTLPTHTNRDEQGNLLVHFGSTETLRVPLIPLRPYQIEAQQKLFVEGVKRLLLARPRRSGKEVESWQFLIEGAIEKPGLYMMVYPTNVRARAVLWDGAMLYKDRSIKFLDMIPKRLLQHVNNQEMKVKLINGSVIWIVGSDIDPDKLRGTNPLGIAFSEFAYQDPRVLHVMLPVLRQNGGWLLAQSTFDGMNHFYQMIEQNKNDPLWYCRIDSIESLIDENGDRYITDEMVEEDRRAGMPEYLIQQEYYGVVQINQETKYFAHALKNIYDTQRIIPDLFIPNANVYSAFDIGMDDSTSVTLFQLKRVDAHLRPVIIGYIESNNQSLAYYLAEISRLCAKFNLRVKEHFIPHDGQKRDFNTGKNTVDFMRESGEVAIVVPRPASKENAIEAMRRMLYLATFNRENTLRLVDCLANYSKEYDDKMGTYKSRPVHNWASHGVDSFQTLTLALDGHLVSDRVYDVVYIN